MEILLGVILLTVCIGYAVVVARRRSPYRFPTQDTRTSSAAHGCFDLHGVCDICKANQQDNTLSLRLLRSDYELFCIREYKRTIAVHVCDSCMRKIWTRNALLALSISVAISSVFMPFLILHAGIANEEQIPVFVISSVVISLLIALFLYLLRFKFLSLYNTWQMEDLKKDGWTISSSTIVNGDFGLTFRRIICVVVILSLIACFAYFVWHLTVK